QDRDGPEARTALWRNARLHPGRAGEAPDRPGAGRCSGGGEGATGIPPRCVVTTMQVFAFGDRKVRTAGTHDAPLFCAADACAVRAHCHVAQACEKLDQEDVVQIGAERGSRPLLYVGQNANMDVTESGLFSLILRSTEPEARAFKRWVTSGVLPAIRKH